MAASIFLKFSAPDIVGGSTDPGHEGDIPILSWNHSFNQASKAPGEGGSAPQQASHADFSLSKYIDAATDDLLRHCWNGDRIGSAQVSCYRADGDNAAVLYLQIDMVDVIVSNVSIGGGMGDLPTETVTLAYGKVTYTYASGHPGSANGESASHDLINRIVS